MADIEWERLARVKTHPLQMRILERVHKHDGLVSLNGLAQELGQPLGNVSHHVKVLVGIGFLVFDHGQPRRGALEHFYRRPTTEEVSG